MQSMLIDLASEGSALRAEGPDDDALVRQLFAESIATELLMLPEAFRAHFVATQRAARAIHWAHSYPTASHFVIVDSRAQRVGRLLASRTDSGVHLIDLALLAPHQGHGIGGAALNELLRYADAHDLAVTLSVLASNEGAQRFYRRFGFAADAGTDDEAQAHSVYRSMRRARHSE